MGGEPEWRPLLQGQADESEPEISPDGNWMAYHSNETGQREVYVQRFPELGERYQVSTGGGGQGRWVNEGDELVYSTLDGRLALVPIETGPPFRIGAKTLLDLGPESVGGYYQVDLVAVSPNGQRFLVPKRGTPTDADSVELVLIQSWVDELQRLVPGP